MRTLPHKFVTAKMGIRVERFGFVCVGPLYKLSSWREFPLFERLSCGFGIGPIMVYRMAEIKE